MCVTKYYVPYKEIFDTIQTVHVTLGHLGVRYTLTEIKKKYANIIEKKLLYLFPIVMSVN